MKIQKFSNERDWLEARLGRVTGTRLKDLVTKNGTKPKIGFYEIIAERIAIPASNENVMDRGHRLEEDAIARFAKEHKKKKVNTDKVIWSRDDDENIAVSPDASIGKTVALEAKCLSSARHLEAYLNKEIPNEFDFQKLQYFIVNEKLKSLFFIFYDPRMPVDFFSIEVKRKDVQEEVEYYLALEKEALVKIADYEKQLTF